jgi:IclR family transcriptional regulator, acetate operon repressor
MASARLTLPVNEGPGVLSEEKPCKPPGWETKKEVAMTRVIGPKTIGRKCRSDQPSQARDGAVQAVDRALLIIETLAEDDDGYRLTDLAVRTGLSPSTAHRLLTTLEKRRFVQFDRSESTWRIGARSFAVGSAFVRRGSFASQALPFLRRLRDQTRETANLAVVDDGAMVILSRLESREITRSVTQVGGRVPMAASGLGKALLSTYSEADVFAIIQRDGMPKLTPKSIVRAGELCRMLHEIRQQGYSVDDEEAQIGLRCVSAVVYDSRSEPLAAISVSGNASRVPDELSCALGGAPRCRRAEFPDQE